MSPDKRSEMSKNAWIIANELVKRIDGERVLIFK